MKLYEPTFTIPEAEWIDVPEPTMNLRFAQRDGRMILQQLWRAVWGNDTTNDEGTAYRWFDVPVEAETDALTTQGEE